MSKYYKIMDHLPKIPDEYVKLALDTIHEKVYSNSYIQNTIAERIITKNGKQYPSRPNPRFDISKEMGEWVNANITKEWHQIGASANVPSFSMPDKESTIHGAHTDETRSYTLLYIIELSNPDQKTVWFQEPGQALHRRRGTRVLDMDSLIELESIQFPIHTWAFLDVSILHSIENIQGSRMTIQIGLDSDVFGAFINN